LIAAKLGCFHRFESDRPLFFPSAPPTSRPVLPSREVAARSRACALRRLRFSRSSAAKRAARAACFACFPDSATAALDLARADAGCRPSPAAGRARIASPRQLAPLWTLWQGSRGFEAAYISVAFNP